MTYELRRGVLGSKTAILLSEDEYDGLLRSRKNLRSVLFVEEQFDLVVNNYIDLEADLLSMAVRWMVNAKPDYVDMQRERNLIINRRMANLLSSCRGYIDQTPHHLNAIGSISDKTALITSKQFKAYTSEQYDKFLDYRVMEELRNYTQHAGFPFAGTYSERWVGEEDDKRLRVTVVPYIDVAMLDKNFKAKVRDEVVSLGKEPPIMPMARQYISSLGSVHEMVRDRLRSGVAEWETLVLDAIERFKEADPAGATIGLLAAKVAENGTFEAAEPLPSQPIEYRRALEERNRNLSTLVKRFVTSNGR